MENTDLYRKVNEQRLIDKAAPKIDMFRVMENLQRSTQFYNSYGIKDKKSSAATGANSHNSGGNCAKKPLSESNN